MESEEDFRNMYPTAISVLNSKHISSAIVYIKKKKYWDMFTKNLKGGGKKKRDLLDGVFFFFFLNFLR